MIHSLIAAARAYVGVPFRHCGRDQNGVDCVGLLLAAMRDAGISDYEPASYSRGDHSRLVAEVERFAVAADGLPEAGDLLLLRVRGEVTHIALMTEAGTILHAHERIGRVVEQTLSPQVLSQVEAVYRWKGAGDALPAPSLPSADA